MMETTKEKNFISAVVYCYNDKLTIHQFIRDLDRSLSSLFLHYEIIIVNDASTDDSVGLIRNYTSSTADRGVITLINMSHHQGLEASMNAGIDLAIGDFVYEFDFAYADFDWQMVEKVYRQLLNGYDIVCAHLEQQPRITSRLFYKIFNRYASLPSAIGSETFRLLSRRAINRIHGLSETIPFRKAAYANSGLASFRLAYRPVCPVVRKQHTDRNSVAQDSLILFTDVAYRLTVGLAVIMAITAASFALFALIYRITSNPVEGWTTTIIFLAFSFFGLFIILAIVIKYLQVLVKLAFHKKQYLFESIEKLQ